MQKLKEEYHNIPIPSELETIVNEALQTPPRKKASYKVKTILAGVAAIILFSISVNVSPSLARTLSDIPIIGKLVEVVTIMEVKKETKNNSIVDIQTPSIQGFENTELVENLNNKYLDESKQLYAEYEKFMATIDEEENANFAVYADYEILTDNDIILSIRRYTEIIQASAYIENQFDTIDKEYEVLLTLKSLFKNDSYVEIISEEIKKQMRQGGGSYNIAEDDGYGFKQIKPDQKFYINTDNKLVIGFNEYEVAPGSMGAVEFVIPTEVIDAILVGHRYIH